MSGAMASEGELNSIVKEYLSYNGFDRAVHSFETECAEKGTPIASTEIRPKTSRKLASIQQEMMQHFENGQAAEFFELWMKHLPQDVRDSDTMAPRLEFLLNVYFTVYPFRVGSEDQEKYVARFRRYLDTRGNQLSKTPEFVSYCALAFVNNPRQVPSFDNLFTDNWTDDVRKRVDSFLKNSLRAKPSPRLLDLFYHGNTKVREIQQMEQRVRQSEKSASYYRTRCSKVQTDYYNLIDVAANLVDTLESYVQGNPVDYAYISKICSRLFSNNVLQTVDFSRPGTAAKTLRETVPSYHMQLQPKIDTNSNSGLDFDKIKMDLISGSERKRALLLQALRWKLTRVTYSERVSTLSMYRSNDLLGCTTSGQVKQAVLNMVSGESNLLRQGIARFLNTISSSWEGRGYLSLSRDLVLKLIKGLQHSSHDPASQEHILASLQKLSLRSNLRPTMIDEGLVNWLVTTLRGCDTMSDYMLEYTIALLMNLTIQSYGRNKCVPLGSQLLKIISNLLGHENLNIRPFVHGTLYSLLRMPSIAEEARSMGMEDILKNSVKDEDDEEKKHVLFLIKRLNSYDEDLDKSTESDDDDDDDDVYEEDQEELEKDLDKDDVLKPQAGELSGNQLLAKHYTVSEVSRNQFKNRQFDNAMIGDDILRRPVTPGYIRSTTAERHLHTGDASAARAPYPSAPPGSRSQRPPTRSGSRPSSRDETVEKMAPREAFEKQRTPATSDHPFASRPKILRTPEPTGRPGSRHNVKSPLQPKYSNSLPRPGSGGRPSSQSSSQMN